MGLTTRKLVYQESIFIVIPAGFTGGAQVNFPDDQYLRNKKLMAIEVVPDLGVFGVAMQYPTGQIVAGLNFLKDAWLTLESYAANQFVRKKEVLGFMNFGLPLVAAPFSVSTQPDFVGQKVNWPNSYIEFPVIPATATETIVVFNVYFTLDNKKSIQAQLGVGFQGKK